MESYLPLFDLLTVLALAGVSWSMTLRARQARTCGRILDRHRPAFAGRLLTLVLAAAAGVAALWLEGVEADGARLHLLAASASTLLLGLVRPSAADALCGERGLRRGWDLVGFEELVEWRLIGEHLRFRLRGEWNAVPLAPDHHADVRRRLVELAGARESVFGHGKDRPQD